MYGERETHCCNWHSSSVAVSAGLQRVIDYFSPLLPGPLLRSKYPCHPGPPSAWFIELVLLLCVATSLLYASVCPEQQGCGLAQAL